mgnify:CR=1 FL=1
MKDAANKFIKFLKDRNLFEAFKTNFDLRGEEFLEEFLGRSRPMDYVSYAFDWGSGDEKFKEFLKWEKLHIEWREYIKLHGAE